MPLLSVIIPCYFNEANIPVTATKLLRNENLFPKDVAFEYVFVDDGSQDRTFEELLKVKAAHPEKVKLVKLVRNVGSYNAVIAGMEFATGDCTVIISADLQDPPELMVKMLEYWRQGFKLVIGNRQDRQDPFLKKKIASVFHAIMRKTAINNLPKGGFDYIFFDKFIREEVLKMKESNSNVMYLIAWLGFEYVSIPYVRLKREIGETRWTFGKNVKLFLDSILSFSYLPIRIIAIMGLLLGGVALLYGMFLIVAKISGAALVEGWSSLMVVLLFVSSFQMIALGVIGEYVWRALDASRKRPLYLIDKVL
ncbi:glycosyltransferase family 2 protein [Rufibacter immobilis]|nr:glycosyltransferase family 2 protein [Rufibacter immobilis]